MFHSWLTAYYRAPLGCFPLALIPTEAKATFTGIWIWNPSESNVTCLKSTEQLILKVEQERDRLTVIEIVEDEQGKTVSKRDYTVEVHREPSYEEFVVCQSAALCEKWTLSKCGDDLLIERSIDGCERAVRFVFKRLNVMDPKI